MELKGERGGGNIFPQETGGGVGGVSRGRPLYSLQERMFNFVATLQPHVTKKKYGPLNMWVNKKRQKASVLMLRLSYPTETVLSNKITTLGLKWM